MQQRLPPDLARRAFEALGETVHDEAALKHVGRRNRRLAAGRASRCRDCPIASVSRARASSRAC